MLDKCANPECCMQFDPLLHGRYFRFHRSRDAGQTSSPAHPIEHFWLCARCAETYALQYSTERGVAISLLLPAERDRFQPRVIRAA